MNHTKEYSIVPNMTSTTEFFKSDFLENNQRWSLSTHQQQQTPESFSSPIPAYDILNFYDDKEDLENNNRVHLRHFSANDSHCTQNNNNQNSFPYLSPSPPTSASFMSPSNIDQHANAIIPEETAMLNSNTEINKKFDLQRQSRRLRFEIVLEAATAVTQKAEESAITYLNRGQVYGIQLNDKQGFNEIITSTLSIAFHSSSHRRIAESYWKFWVGQQKQPKSRAIDIDASQSTGLSDLKFPSFDKITFNWNGRFGAKIYVRFKCLSTDFSRIKGVKGIPLRTQMESHAPANITAGVSELNEICFCKVKLFRDKGAERKNKDDAKQISKQLEKVYGKANEQSLPLMYNVSLPYSIFGEIPTSSTLDSFEHAVDDLNFPIPNRTPARFHTRVMTAPNSLIYQSKKAGGNGSGRKSISTVIPPCSPMTMEPPQDNAMKSSSPILDAAGSSVVTPSTPSNFISKTKENYDFQKYLAEQQQALAALPSINTNNLVLHSNTILPDYDVSNNASHYDDDLPPLTSDATTLHTPATTQATPTEFYGNVTTFDQKLFYGNNNANSALMPDLLADQHFCQPTQNSSSVMMATIYDVFTPEEIRKPLESCSITPTQEELAGFSPRSTHSPSQPQFPQLQRDYFCSMEPSSSHISLLQQQLQFHNETASNIILSNNTVSNMLLLSPPGVSIIQRGRKKKRAHSDVIEEDRILTYSSNPSHKTLSSNSSNSSIVSEPAAIVPTKKTRQHNISP